MYKEGDVIKEILYWIWIARMKYLYFEIFDLLIKKYKTVANLWNVSAKELKECELLRENILNDFLNKEYRKNLDKYYEYIIRNNIKIITCYDKMYPFKLNFIKNKPIVLFCKGDLCGINNESVAIVGSRKCTEYGRNCAKFFSYELSKRGLNIVSGLALGIDTVAHCSCLNANGKTLAVIGGGLDCIYPKQNEALAQKIITSGGVIISEYVVGTKPDKINFPRRNRIISGLSNTVIIVEAGKKSGSLITANYAVNQGKEVWVVPGSIFSDNYAGSNELIRDGANILTGIEDIVR